MLAHMHDRARQKAPHILAVETAVVDLQYPAGGGDDVLKHEFFAHLKELLAENGGIVTFPENPRPGDMALVMAEDFDDALVTFAHRHHLMPADQPVLPRRMVAESIRERLFGQPVATAGGSLANTFHALVNSRIDGQKLVTGHFTTAVGANRTGQTFIDSLTGHIHCNRKGRQMECHVFPIDGDRILIATPSKADPAEAHIERSLFRHPDGNPANRDRILVGGFLYFTPGFHDIYDSVIDHLQALPEGKRPSLALTAAAQSIAASPDFRRKIERSWGLTDTVIHANSGEFRRLFDMDTDWRKPFEADFAGLRGKKLDEAKNAHAPYKAAKDAANAAAIAVAIDLCRKLAARKGDLLFVITNGARETFIVDAKGCLTTHPNKIDRADIVNTVGAGDNFAAGFQLGHLYGMPHQLSAKIGSDFAAAIIQSPAARLSEKDSMAIRQGQHRMELSGALAKLRGDTLAQMLPKPPVSGATLQP